MAGYIWKAATNSPFNNRSIDRWNPHPKHSIPKRVLLKQGNIYFSKSNGFVFDVIAKIQESCSILNDTNLKFLTFEIQ